MIAHWREIQTFAHVVISNNYRWYAHGYFLAVAVDREIENTDIVHGIFSVQLPRVQLYIKVSWLSAMCSYTMYIPASEDFLGTKLPRQYGILTSGDQSVSHQT